MAIYIVYGYYDHKPAADTSEDIKVRNISIAIITQFQSLHDIV